jgi:Glutamine synthetase adenylyltransferase
LPAICRQPSTPDRCELPAMTVAAPLSPPLQACVERALARLQPILAQLPAPLAAGEQALLQQLVIASDFAIDTLLRQPALLGQLLAPGCPPIAPPRLDPDQPSEWPVLLRRYRAAASTRLIWRDLAGLDPVEATLAGATVLAEQCLGLALDALEAEFASRHGVVRAEDGSVQRLVVFGLGKLGGGELNFSSDIDLVYAYPQGGESDGHAVGRRGIFCPPRPAPGPVAG